jgi:hypothetical protein
MKDPPEATEFPDPVTNGIVSISFRPSTEADLRQCNKWALLTALSVTAFPWQRMELAKLKLRDRTRQGGDITFNEDALNSDLWPENAVTRFSAFYVAISSETAHAQYISGEVDHRAVIGCLISDLLSTEEIPVRL